MNNKLIERKFSVEDINNIFEVMATLAELHCECEYSIIHHNWVLVEKIMKEYFIREFNLYLDINFSNTLIRPYKHFVRQSSFTMDEVNDIIRTTKIACCLNCAAENDEVYHDWHSIHEFVNKYINKRFCVELNNKL